MQLKDYQEATKRTLPDLGTESLNIAHMIFGLNSEYSELYNAKDTINRSEEFADIAWYLSNYCNFKNIDLWRIFEFIPGEYYSILPDDDYIQQLQCVIADVTDLEKRILAYKKNIEREVIIVSVSEIAERLNDCYTYYNINPFDSLEKNIDKLKARYPEKFSEDMANNRDLEKERKVLEQ